jgi:CRP-like cAMP-binding protein
MKTYEVRSGDVIFREGDVGEFACIIRSGRVQILKSTKHGEIELAILNEGDVFGEMALFEPLDTRSATARALDNLVVDVLSAEEMFALVEQSPPMLQPFIKALVSRLRENNRRLAEKERATIILGNQINTIALHPAGAIEALADAITLTIADLPFSIGGYSSQQKRPYVENMEIPCAPDAMNISFLHCAIERHEDGIYVVDKGSRFCTHVNGRSIGRGQASTKALLTPADNEILLGKPEAAMMLKVICS